MTGGLISQVLPQQGLQEQVHTGLRGGVGIPRGEVFPAQVEGVVRDSETQMFPPPRHTAMEGEMLMYGAGPLPGLCSALSPSL